MITKKNIGIWGFGRVGKSVAQMLHAQGHAISVMTKDALSTDEKLLAQKYAIHLYTQDEKQEFFNRNDVLVPSPGVDIRGDYQTQKDKWLTELDLFYAHFKKPIIAVTGTVGKTTITTMLDQILKAYKIPICTGGNIGIPMCDLIMQQDILIKSNEYALLEVSSFQLEYCTQFTPYIAIWTNLAPNHLDRHATYDAYFEAKYNLLAHQDKTDKALVPLSLAQNIKNKAAKSMVHYFSSTAPTEQELKNIQQNEPLFFIDGNHIKKKIGDTITTLINLDTLPDITFIENWLIICSALEILSLDLCALPIHIKAITLPEHRMEKIAVASRDIIFYNDSKSTTTTSTRAAIQKLAGKSIILFVGGLSKGVDRAQFIKELKDQVKQVYCFGAEADTLNAYCVLYGINADAFSTLDDAFAACVKNTTVQDCVLFSPAGSSYDLFKDYEERGNYFKTLVRNFIASDTNDTNT